MSCSFLGFAVFCNKTFLGASIRAPLEAALCQPRFVCSLRDSSQSRLSRREFALLLSLTASSYVVPRGALSENIQSAYDIVARKNGEPFPLAAYRNKLTLFVNVATYCALTPQYEGLVALHDEYQPRGFEIVASPCDQFGHQEPGSNDEICAFAKKQFGAKFLLLDKLNVNDAPGGVAPLYKFLKDTSPEGTGQRVSWNFEKFLVGVNGNVLRRYKPGILPEDIETDIKWALEHPGEPLPPKKKPSLGVS
ncbi:Glutathione peroxidase [Gracilariopsis chorda]|uniref:Glutathione peroxidase n=1 Tax=Gracilariopsis chorda TaxID=448386 RepID=A0A2V3IQJ4_9FLOR|nr:Glutathione peroxidase [Gracilariopsis chorda]|eukprot:PXF43420.1 Glutathione peroxidase [Gracilariopsis chorda]